MSRGGCCTARAPPPIFEEGGEEGSNEAELALRAELALLKLGALQRRAVEEGVDQSVVLDAIDDEGDPREKLTAIIVTKCLEACGGQEHEAMLAALRLELSKMTFGQLQKRAITDGVDPSLTWDAADADDPKEQLIELIAGMCVPAVDTEAKEHEMRVAALKVELEQLRLGELQKRAVSEGCDPVAVMDAIDSDSAKGDIIGIIIAHCLPWSPVPSPAQALKASAEAAAAAAAREHEAKMERVRADLATLKLGELNQRALAKGIPQQSLNDALDTDVPKDAVLELLIATIDASERCEPTDKQFSREDLKDLGLSSSSDEDYEFSALTESLSALKLGALSARAMDVGISSSALTDAQDADEPKQAIVALLVEHARANSRQRAPPVKSQRRPHHGGAIAHPRRRSRDRDERSSGNSGGGCGGGGGGGGGGTRGTSPTRLSPSVRSQSMDSVTKQNRFFAPGKHAMLSYQWGEQKKVIAAREELAKHGVPCWMDIDGGMQSDIFASMAQGVENAACIVAFISQPYQDSVNCQSELKFARQCGVPIVPVNLGGGDWRATGWLGIVIAGTLWNVLNEETFDSDIQKLVQQIQAAVPVVETTGDDNAVLSREELRAEFARLVSDIDASNKPPEKSVSFNPDEPAVLARGVPELPHDFRETAAISWLRDVLLHRGETSDCRKTRVGFFGMGGIGKTVTGAALVQDMEIRTMYDQIVWIPLGQTPVIDKLQRMELKQLTGEEIPNDMSQEDRYELLRRGFAGKKVLLCLDDLWEETHETELNFVDPDTESRVVISTRVRGLLQGAASIEVNVPSEKEAIRILMAAAEVPTTNRAPRGASEIVRQCGRLPLALGMAGKLIVQLGLGSQEWDGLTAILRDELRENEDTSNEQRVIRASLAGLRGSEREKTGVRQLFKLFALVPEDTVAPLQTLQLMYDAVYNCTTPTSLLHIRKWLKVLVDRSLVLGTVDRASLHDLVLDFTCGLFEDSELKTAHRKVVNTFRAGRTVSAAGIPAWLRSNRGDPTSFYVLSEIEHHVRNAIDLETVASDQGVLVWLEDQPFDCIGEATANVLGLELLDQVATAAEEQRTPDYWAATCRWGASAVLALKTVGRTEPFLVRTRKSLDTVALIDNSSHMSGRNGIAVPMTEGRGNQHAQDLLEMTHIVNVFFALVPEDRDKYLCRCSRLLQSRAAKAAPADCYMISVWSTVAVAFFNGDLETIAIQGYIANVQLVQDGCINAADRNMKEFCSMANAGWWGWFGETFMTGTDEFSWTVFLDSFYMAAETYSLRPQVCVPHEPNLQMHVWYDYDRHHHELIEWSNNDVMIVGVAGLVGIAWHAGDLDVAAKQLEKMFDGNKRASLEANQQVEALGLALCCSSMSAVFAYQLGYRRELRSQMQDLGFTWTESEASVVKHAVTNPTYFRELGSREMNSLMSTEAVVWQAKLTYVLVADWRDVPKADDIIAALPSPDELSEFLNTMEHAETKETLALGIHFFCHHLLAALVCEKFGRLEDALTYVNVIFDREPNRGGDHKTTSHVSGLCLKGRVLAAQGRKEQAEAMIEAAIEKAEAFELNLMVALALRDLCCCVLTSGPRNRASRSRLGAVLRKLKGPADKLTALLGEGLDATQLMLM